jgi:uncharacterized delta-60 repeat protein
MRRKIIDLRGKTLFVMLTIGFLFIFETPKIKAAPGDPDPGFGSGGMVEYTSLNKLFMNRIALQTDGKILVAGSRITSQTERLYLRRYNADGSLDTAFGLGGEAIEQLTPSNYSYIYGKYPSKIALLSDGSILIGGQRLSNTGGFLGISVWKFKPDGLLDKSFDGDGRKDLSSISGQLLDPTDMVQKVLLTKATVSGTAQTKILVLCTYNNHHVYGAEENLADWSAVFRLNPDGSYDTGFGNNGKTEISDEFNDAAVYKPPFSLADEYIYLAGIGNDNPGVRRLTNDGTIDTTFADAGLASIGNPYSNAAFKNMAVQKDGKFYLSGYSNPAAGILYSYVYLMNANGVFEQDFGNYHLQNGIGLIDIPGYYDAGVGLQPDGMLLVGTVHTIARYWPNGRLNAWYPSDDYGISCFAVQKDKKAVVLANIWDYEQGDHRGYKLTRYLAD